MKTPSQPNASVIGAMECLEAVVAAQEPVGGRELARQLGLQRVRVNRLLMTLAHCGLLERTDEGRYRPGPGVHALAAMASEGSSLQRVAIPHIRPWWREGFSVTLGVLWRQYICYLIRARPEVPLEEGLGGRRGPALESSAGLMLLASLPAAELKRFELEEGPPRAARSPGTTELIGAARRDGFARITFEDGTVSVGCPVGQAPIAALAVSKKGLGDLRPTVDRLRATAAAIAADLESLRPPAARD